MVKFTNIAWLFLIICTIPLYGNPVDQIETTNDLQKIVASDEGKIPKVTINDTSIVLEVAKRLNSTNGLNSTSASSAKIMPRSANSTDDGAIESEDLITQINKPDESRQNNTSNNLAIPATADKIKIISEIKESNATLKTTTVKSETNESSTTLKTTTISSEINQLNATSTAVPKLVVSESTTIAIASTTTSLNAEQKDSTTSTEVTKTSSLQPTSALITAEVTSDFIGEDPIPAQPGNEDLEAIQNGEDDKEENVDEDANKHDDKEQAKNDPSVIIDPAKPEPKIPGENSKAISKLQTRGFNML